MTRYALQIYRRDPAYPHEVDGIPMASLPFSPLLLDRLSAIGAIVIKSGMLTSEDAEKVGRILRLRRSLGVNLSGAAIITELMDRLEKWESENPRQRGWDD